MSVLKAQGQQSIQLVFVNWTDMNVGANGDRVRIELYDPTVTTWSIETYCSPNAAPDSEEYNVIVRQGLYARPSITHEKTQSFSGMEHWIYKNVYKKD